MMTANYNVTKKDSMKEKKVVKNRLNAGSLSLMDGENSNKAV